MDETPYRTHVPPRARRLPGFLLRLWVAFSLLLAFCLLSTLIGIRAASAAAGEIASITPQPPAPHSSALADGSHITSAQCATCHVTEPVLSHAVNVAPSMAIPAAFPLDNGQINCTTCHLDSFAQHTLAKTSGNAMLRGPDGAAFCAQCHQQTALTAQSQHPLALSQAHMGWVKGGPAIAKPTQAAPHTGTRADGLNSCLSCHDGTIAADAFGGMAKGLSSGSSGTINAANHPVGMAYPVADILCRQKSLVPLAQLDHRIMLTNGQMTCLSCHSLYSTQTKLLVMRNDQSALCASCHTN